MSETGMSAVEAAKELGFYTELSTAQSASLTASLEDNNAELTAAA
jgi:hypothetical protein